MKRKADKDVLEIIRNFQKSLDNKPTLKKMYEEIQMMKFKVKPIQGDLSMVNLNNERFISVLWSLGKLEEFFKKELKGLSGKNKELFSRVFDSIYHKYQQDLNKINLHVERKSSISSLLEVEIFKEVKNNSIN